MPYNDQIDRVVAKRHNTLSTKEISGISRLIQKARFTITRDLGRADLSIGTNAGNWGNLVRQPLRRGGPTTCRQSIFAGYGKQALGYRLYG